MNEIQSLYDALNTIKTQRINQLVIDPTDDGIRFRGSDDKESTIVFSDSTQSYEMLNGKSLGISNVDTLCKRLSLFDLSKDNVNVNFESKEGTNFIHRLKISYHKQKMTYTFSNPDHCRGAPKAIHQSDVISSINTDKTETEHLLSAIAATKAEIFCLEGSGDETVVRLYDGNADTYTDMLGTNDAGEWSYSWRADSISLLLKESLRSGSNSVVYNVIRGGLGQIDVNNISFYTLPQVTD